jgi:hypothetical protein
MPLSTAAFPCCRDHDLFAPVEEYPQRIQRTPGDEAYWFGWDSSFDGKATIRIAKLRDLAIPPHGRLRPHGRRESAAAKRSLRA